MSWADRKKPYVIGMLIVASLIGMLPGTLLYAYYGVLAGDVARLAGGTAVERGPGYYAVLVLGLLATIAVSTLVTRAARRALRSAGDDDGPSRSSRS